MRYYQLAFIILISFLIFQACEKESPDYNNPLDPINKSQDSTVIADFEREDSRINNCEGVFGSWTQFRYDTTQGCIDTVIVGSGYNGGNSLRVTYDVDSPNPLGALCGLFFKCNPDTLGFKNLSNFNEDGYIVIRVKGDSTAGFTKKFQIEFQGQKTGPNQGDREKERTFVKDVTHKWEQFVIPIIDFIPWITGNNQPISDWSKINEFTITFADVDINPSDRTGIIYIDDIVLYKYKP